MSEGKLLHRMLLYGTVFSITAMAFMILYLCYREVPTNAEALVAENGMNDLSEAGMLHSSENQEMNALRIPLPENFSDEQLEIINDIHKKKISILVKKIDKNFFYSHPLTGSNTHIQNLLFGFDNETARIDLLLDNVYEYNATIENHYLDIELKQPRAIYPSIVVLDPGHGGEDTGTVAYGEKESEINLAITEIIQEKLSNHQICCYMTRENDKENPSSEERTKFADEVSADLFLSIHCSADSKTRTTTGMNLFVEKKNVSMNEIEFNFADSIKQALTIQTGNPQNTINIMNEIPSYSAVQVPTVMIQLGYLTNKQEALKLCSQEYMENVAEGITQGILNELKEKRTKVE